MGQSDIGVILNSLEWLENVSNKQLGVKSKEQFAELLVVPERVIDEVTKERDEWDELAVHREDNIEIKQEMLLEGIDVVNRPYAFSKFVLSLEYKRLAWSLGFINNYGGGSIDQGDFGLLGDRIQTGEDYIYQIIMPILRDVNLVEVKDDNYCLTESWYSLHRSKK